MRRLLILALPLLAITFTPGCGVIALAMIGTYMYDHPNGPPPATAPAAAPTTTQPTTQVQ